MGRGRKWRIDVGERERERRRGIAMEKKEGES